MARIVIVGGGIGGLATALATARRGHRVELLERSGRFAELGAGIQLAPNGIHALHRLGLADAVLRIAVPVDELRLYDGVSGERVTSVPLTGAYRARFGNPYVVVHRGELYTLLLAACRADDRIVLRAGCRVRRYEQDGTHATVLLDGGEQVSGDVVIGADGIRSAIRAQLLADGPPRVSGITVYRSVIPMNEVPPDLRWNCVTWWTGPGCHFVHYPIEGGRSLNLAASNTDGAVVELSGVVASAEHTRRAMAGLGAAAHQLLALGRDWRSWVLVDREPVPRWTDGRVALLGDAAHPMLHYAAQGACVTLEDAVLLGGMLDGADPTILERWVELRRDRTAAVQRAARESIKLWHPAGDAAVARNALLGGMSPPEQYDHLAWMHGFRALDAPVPA